MDESLCSVLEEVFLSWPEPCGSCGCGPYWSSKPDVLGTCLSDAGLKVRVTHAFSVMCPS